MKNQEQQPGQTESHKTAFALGLPIATPASGALTGIPVLDACVRDYRMVPKVLTELRSGLVRRNEEALLQARSELSGGEDPAAIAILDAGLKNMRVNIDTVNRAMHFAATRRTAVGAYVEAGEHCYEVSAGLAERLSKTELHGVTGNSLRLPFNSIAIVVPEEFQHLAQVVFVSTLQENKVNNLVTGELGAMPVLSIVALHLDDEKFKTVSICIKLDKGDLRGALAESTLRFRDNEYTSLEGGKENITRVFWWTVNVCLYITHAGAEAEPRHPNVDAERNWRTLSTEPGPKRRQRLLNMYNSKFRQRIYLGRSVEPLGLVAHRGPINVRTFVAGHWRNQVCGVGRQERRLTWIEPFWRGPKDAPESNPIRVLSESRFAVG